LSFYKESVAVRIPKDDFCQKLISEFNKPITSTSVNISGNKFPECFDEIKDDILNQIDYAVNLKRNQKLKTPSQIIKIDGDSFNKLRS
jgi:L-threonylcarbamoyladenylate synthase